MTDVQKITLHAEDIKLINIAQEKMLNSDITPPSWKDATEERMTMFSRQIESLIINEVRDHSKLKTTAGRIADALVGVGLLQPYLRDPDVDEIYVRGNEIAVERSGKMHRQIGSAPAEYWAQLIHRVADLSGKTVEPGHPAVLVDLPGGARFTGMLPPLMDAPAINVRVFRKSARTFSDLRELGTFDNQNHGVVSGTIDDIIDPDLRQRVELLDENSIERFLAWVVASQSGNIIVAGQFSSGKTTLLNAISSYVPSDAPVAILETFRELQLSENLFTMRAIAPSSKEDSGGTFNRATMEWVLNTIYTRANPGAIILGEIVAPGEAMQFLKAANLGRRAYSTIHGGTIRSALGRLETLALADQPNLGLTAIRRMIADGLDLVVLMNRVLHKDGAYRYVAEIQQIVGVDANAEYIINPIYSAGDVSGSDTILTASKSIGVK
jgi:pilus assembly protein CpaF